MITYIVAPGNIPEKMKVYGLQPDFTRMPRVAAEAVSPAVADISRCASGGRIRFRTDSNCITLKVTLEAGACNGATDVVCDGVYRGKVEGGENDAVYGGTLLLTDVGHSAAGHKRMHDVTVFTTRTGFLKQVEISLDDGSTVEEPTPYAIEKPIVFYGSSITMGACSKSPSKAYTALVAERLCADHINLGFGGNAKGEAAMAEYIASLDMSAFVMDYEHNADTLEDLLRTHKPFFDTVRAAHPTLPILIISRPDAEREFLRACYGRRIVMNTFYAALDAGDKWVDYVDGFYLKTNENKAACCAEDGCHPNELGFSVMADVIAPRLRDLMERDVTVDTMGQDGFDAIFPTHI